MGARSNAQKVRREVLDGKRKKTSGGLTRGDLMVKGGRIKSIRASQVAKRNKNLPRQYLGNISLLKKRSRK